MKLRYRSNLLAGIIGILGGVVVLLIIPSQIGKDYTTTYGITSKTVPQAVAVMWIVCGLVLIVQSVFLHKDTVKTLEIGKELKAVLYMSVLVAYLLTFRYSFLIATMALGVLTLAFTGCKKPLYYAIVLLTVVLIYLAFTYALHVKLP
ncbi:MAG: tripartite tricarboxylate transporter TctB family protein [Clostridia bacterium]|nr:tripartite tricarboxylate transporter TctB family protein [Clostridia bacterium]